MKPWERWALHLLTVGISVSGLLYFWMKYLLAAQDPFSVVNHPWQSAMLEIHLLLAPLIVFLLGMIVHSHVARKLRSKTRSGRRTGVLSLIAFPIMALSGYVLQILSNPAWINAMVVVHLAGSGLFMVSYATHWIVKLKAIQRRGRRQPQPIGIDLQPGGRHKLGTAARHTIGQTGQEQPPLPFDPTLIQPSVSDSHASRLES